MMLGLKPKLSHRALHAIAGGLVQRRVAHDAAFAHLALAHFKLRLDQYDHLPAVL